jgi:hypothetical protein
LNELSFIHAPTLQRGFFGVQCEMNLSSYAGLQVIDVSNPNNPQRVGGYDTSGYALGVAVSGNYA